MMATAHEEWLERSEFYALGALDEQELKEFEAHLASGCAICEAYVRETREALLLLHRSITPMTPSASVKTRLFHDIASEKVVPLPPKPRSTWRRWQVITGTLAAGIVGAVLAGTLITKRYEPRHTLYTSVINLLRDPATRDFPLYGTGPTPKAAGRFLWNESGEGHIFVTNLPAAPEGKMYAVWTIAQRSAPRYVGTIQTDRTGQGGLHINTPRTDQAVETFAVTLEPVGTTAAPTGPMVLVSKPT
ncbi:MAG TPA: anti-sigma factor [Candidatus Binatia bacterium]|nr:anti-sigma factor [Candidatus Binatia bacterium]